MTTTSKGHESVAGVAWLKDHLQDAGVRVIGILREPPPPAGAEGQIPGADAFYWKDLLWDGERRDFPEPEEFARRMSALGIAEDTHIVAYGDAVQFGFYARWALRYLGCIKVSVLDGGLPAWKRDGLPVATTGSRAHPATTFAPRARNEATRIGRDELLRRLNEPKLVILDARSREEYLGERVSPNGTPDVGAERGGHVPGAVHMPATDLLNESGQLRSADELRKRVTEQLRLDPAGEVVVYCRLSHRGSLLSAALTEVLGFSNVRLYDGSWTEWGSLVGVPVEKGEGKKG